MGRRRDHDDDEDEIDDEDERPSRRRAKKKEKSNTTLLVVLAGVAVVLIAACGGVAWYAISSAKKVVDNMAGQFGSTAEAEEFLSKISSGQTQAAYDSTAPAFKSSMTRERFQQLLASQPLLTKHTDTRPLTSQEPTGKAPNRKHAISYELTELDEDFDPDDDDPPLPVKKPKGKKGAPAGPKSLTVTITVAEQPGGLWKVEGLTVP